MSIVSVSLGPDSYDILIESGVLDEVGFRAHELLGVRRVAIVTDDNVRRQHYADRLQSGLEAAGLHSVLVTITPGEKQKTLRTAELLYNRFFELKLDRHSTVMALGGGVVGDLAGFVASTYMRGIAFLQVPTTLLAQVDSSVGGKTGVDLPQGKNLVGTFYQPRAVFIDPAVLRTLPPREVAAGMAEVIKHGMIADAEFFRYLESHVRELQAQDPATLEYVIQRCCEIKVEVVQRDEHDEGLRGILNFGHTFGHAIEAATGYRTYRHGEAIAIGMVLACDLAVALNMFAPDQGERLRRLFEQFGLPHTLGRADLSRVMRLLPHDKKSQGGRPKFILPTEIGQVVMRGDVSDEIIRSVL
jgi:3-dehydroquinate synthase